MDAAVSFVKSQLGLDVADSVVKIGLVGGVALLAYVAYSVLNAGEKVGLDKENFRKFKIVKKENVTHNTRRFTCALQTPTTRLGLPTGQHMSIRGMASPGFTEEIIRSYTPTSSDDDLGYFELVIKIYPDGKLTPFLDRLNVGDYMEARGPKGRIHYYAPSKFKIGFGTNPKTFNAPKINMIAGGTGLTPMYQVIQNIVRNPNDNSKVKMIFGNVSEDDILCREEMEQIRKHKNIDCVFTLDKANPGWKEEEGYVTAEKIKRLLFAPGPDTATLLCGPPGLIKGCNAALKELGHERARIWGF